MQVSLNTSKWYQQLWAALMFFTRLPWWRWYQPPKEAFKAVVEYWPLTGWLTASVMAAVLYGASLVIPYSLAIILAIVTRMLLTGALHEDGLADFFDGFGGGGNNRQRILDIMKDSHIGTYGVLALVLYIALLFLTLHSLQPADAALAIFMADPYAKMISAQMVQMMPYARTEVEAKNHTVYRKFNISAGISLAIQGMLPLALFLYLMQGRTDWQLIVFPPCIVMYFLYLFIWKRLRGYTGDCCGAVFLLTELAILLTVKISLTN